MQTGTPENLAYRISRFLWLILLLASLFIPGVALAVTELIKDRDEWVRSAAIMALNRIGPTADCLPFLAGALQHQNDDNRRAAVRALAGSKENAAYAAAVRSNQDAQHGLPRTDSDTP